MVSDVFKNILLKVILFKGDYLFKLSLSIEPEIGISFLTIENVCFLFLKYIVILILFCIFIYGLWS